MDSSVLCIVLISTGLVAGVYSQVALLYKRASALSRIEAKLDLLLKNAGLTYDPFAELPPGVAEAVRKGEKIEAIKRYRETTGVGLKEAKEFVEEVQRRAGLVA
jgi:hypothetical protein